MTIGISSLEGAFKGEGVFEGKLVVMKKWFLIAFNAGIAASLIQRFIKS